MSYKSLICPHCGNSVRDFKNPVPTTDIIIEAQEKEGQIQIVLIKRKNPPEGWAIPGGYVDYGELLEESAVREAKEETSLDVVLIRQFHTYSDPARDERQHNITTVFIAKIKSGTLTAASDAKDAKLFNRNNLPENLVFDHREILEDYFNGKY